MGFESSRKKLVGKDIESHYSTEQILMVQVPKSEIYEGTGEVKSDHGPIQYPPEKTSWLKRHVSSSKSKTGPTIGIRMTKAEFTAFFARDERTGQYKDGVVEPPEGRKAWLQKRLPENDPNVWDTQAVESRQLASTAGLGYYAGLAGPY